MLEHKSLMRPVAILAVVIFCAAISTKSQANSGVLSDMPKRIRAFLDNMCGSWCMDGATKGTFNCKWDPGRSTLVGVEQFQNVDGSGTLSDIWYWDGISEDGVILNWSCLNNGGFGYGQVKGKLLSNTLMEGVVRGIEFGLTFSADVRMEFQSPSQYTWRRTNAIVDGEQQPDSTVVFTRTNAIDAEHVAERNKATVRRYVEQLVNNTSGDYSKAHEIISPDFTLYYDGKALEPRGIDFFKEGVERNKKSFSRLELIDNEMIAEDNTVAVRWHDEAVHDRGDFEGYPVVPNEENMTWNGMSFYNFDDKGLMTEGYIVCDDFYVLEMRRRAAEVEAMTDKRALSPEMKKLAVFVGDWVYEGKQENSPMPDLFGEAGRVSGTIEARFVLDGSFLETKWEDKNPAGIAKIIEITGYDPTEKNYVANGYVSDGSRDTTHQTTSSDGRIWTSRKTFTTSTGKEVLLKCVLTFSQDWYSYISTEEYSVDGGKTWIHWYKFEARKVDHHKTEFIKD